MAKITRDEYKDLLRNSLRAFTAKAFYEINPSTPYLSNYHIDLIAEYLEACYRGEITRLIINMPPRMCKSIAVNVAFPAWILGRDPAKRIMSVSYAQGLSNDHSKDTRKILMSDWYKEVFPECQIAPDSNQIEEFRTTKNGRRLATSITGQATGKGGDFIIIDDPHNPKQALSETQRKVAIREFDQTFSNRLNNKKTGVIILVMQRLHQDDLTGHLLAQGGWVHLCLPMVAEKDEILQFGKVRHVRKEGDLLHEERMGNIEIDREKVASGSYNWAGQYQQRPAPQGGGVFKEKWFQWYKERPEKFKRIIQSWDTAYKKEEWNDPSVCTTWGETNEGTYYLLHVLCKRMEYPEVKAKIVQMAGYWQANTVLIEDKASGQSLLQDIRNNHSSIPVTAFVPQGDKLSRAHEVTNIIESGRVFIPERNKDGTSSWVDDFLDELLLFPESVHDDQVDSLSQFLRWVTLQSYSRINLALPIQVKK